MNKDVVSNNDKGGILRRQSEKSQPLNIIQAKLSIKNEPFPDLTHRLQCNIKEEKENEKEDSEDGKAGEALNEALIDPNSPPGERKYNNELPETMARDNEEEDEEEVEIVLPSKFNQRDSRAVQLARIAKKIEKGNTWNDPGIEEEPCETEVDYKKWSSFSPEGNKKKRGSYFAQLKKAKDKKKKAVRFQANNRKDSKISPNKEPEIKIPEIVEEKIEEVVNDKISQNLISEQTEEEKNSNRDDLSPTLIINRNANSLGVPARKGSNSSSDEEGGVQNYDKWDKFNPQKKKKRPLSFAVKKNKMLSPKPSTFNSTRNSRNIFNDE